MPVPDMRLEEPKPEGERNLEEKILEICEIETRATKEHRQANTTEEREYWQGKKDGVRGALLILEPDESIWKTLLSSSHGSRATKEETLLALLKDARYNIGAALDDYSEKDGHKIHIQTIINLLQWLASYDRLAGKGDLPELKDAITPSWENLTNRRR